MLPAQIWHWNKSAKRWLLTQKPNSLDAASKLLPSSKSSEKHQQSRDMQEKGKRRQITVLALHLSPISLPIFSWKPPNHRHDFAPGKKARSLLEITFLRGGRQSSSGQSSELEALSFFCLSPRAASSLCRPGLGCSVPGTSGSQRPVTPHCHRTTRLKVEPAPARSRDSN